MSIRHAIPETRRAH